MSSLNSAAKAQKCLITLLFLHSAYLVNFQPSEIQLTPEGVHTHTHTHTYYYKLIINLNWALYDRKSSKFLQSTSLPLLSGTTISHLLIYPQFLDPSSQILSFQADCFTSCFRENGSHHMETYLYLFSTSPFPFDIRKRSPSIKGHHLFDL